MGGGSGIERQEPGSSKEEGVGYRRASQPRKRSRDAASLHFPFTVGQRGPRPSLNPSGASRAGSESVHLGVGVRWGVGQRSWCHGGAAPPPSLHSLQHLRAETWRGPGSPQITSLSIPGRWKRSRGGNQPLTQVRGEELGCSDSGAPSASRHNEKKKGGWPVRGA